MEQFAWLTANSLKQRIQNCTSWRIVLRQKERERHFLWDKNPRAIHRKVSQAYDELFNLNTSRKTLEL